MNTQQQQDIVNLACNAFTHNSSYELLNDINFRQIAFQPSTISNKFHMFEAEQGNLPPASAIILNIINSTYTFLRDKYGKDIVNNGCQMATVIVERNLGVGNGWVAQVGPIGTIHNTDVNHLIVNTNSKVTSDPIERQLHILHEACHLIDICLDITMSNYRKNISQYKHLTQKVFYQDRNMRLIDVVAKTGTVTPQDLFQLALGRIVDTEQLPPEAFVTEMFEAHYGITTNQARMMAHGGFKDITQMLKMCKWEGIVNSKQAQKIYEECIDAYFDTDWYPHLRKMGKKDKVLS